MTYTEYLMSHAGLGTTYNLDAFELVRECLYESLVTDIMHIDPTDTKVLFELRHLYRKKGHYQLQFYKEVYYSLFKHSIVMAVLQ